MAAKTAGDFQVLSPVGIGNLTDVDTTARFALGTRCTARDMGATGYGEGEFIYLAGATSVARGSVVTISSANVAVLIAARAIGSVAVALAAVDAATKYGWFQTMGKGVALCDSTITDGAALYIDGTSGRVDDTVVAGDAVMGMKAASTDDTNTVVVNMTSRCLVGDFDNA